MEEKKGNETCVMRQASNGREACTAEGCVKGCIEHRCEMKGGTSDDGAEIRGRGYGR